MSEPPIACPDCLSELLAGTECWMHLMFESCMHANVLQRFDGKARAFVTPGEPGPYGPVDQNGIEYKCTGHPTRSLKHPDGVTHEQFVQPSPFYPATLFVLARCDHLKYLPHAELHPLTVKLFGDRGQLNVWLPGPGKMRANWQWWAAVQFVPFFKPLINEDMVRNIFDKFPGAEIQARAEYTMLCASVKRTLDVNYASTPAGEKYPQEHHE